MGWETVSIFLFLKGLSFDLSKELVRIYTQHETYPLII